MSKQALKKNRIRKGDVVIVIAGRDRGKSGKVLSVDPGVGKVVVEKLNMIKRHTKPNQKVKQGGILERETQEERRVAGTAGEGRGQRRVQVQSTDA